MSYLGETDGAGRLGIEYAAEEHPAIRELMFERTTEEWWRLTHEGRHYIIGRPKSQLKNSEQHLVDRSWQQVYERLEVKLCLSPEETHELFILCRKKARKEKTTANLFRDRIKARA